MDATLLEVGLGTLAAGALLTFLLPGTGRGAAASRYVALLSVLGASGSLIALAVRILAGGAKAAFGPVKLWQPPVLDATLTVRIDAISAFFLLVIATVSIAAAWYAVGYTRKLHESLRGFYPPFLLFILGMVGVVVVDDFFFFFVPWELMALASYVLVVFHKDDPQSLKAGFRYFFITHVGTLALFFGVTLLAIRGDGFQFASLRATLPGLLATQPAVVHFCLLLILLGFLVKAGGYPFGLWWLPEAHPAAPAPVSALLSGVMIKLGLYGVLRVFFDLLPAGEHLVAWGVLIALFGVASLFFGTIQALVQHDSKRLLAFHSIGQVGYMLLGFGIGLALAQRAPVVAALGMIGGLFHLANHACFKALLFLNAGVFEVATGERDLNKLGGLSRLMPVTAVCTIIASLSIAGLPLLSGFTSKWLLYHASLWGGSGVGIIFLYCGIVALFISAVTLASFLKFMGATLWGIPSPATLAAGKSFREGPWLTASQVFLALLCVGLGVLPHAGAWLCRAAVETLPLMSKLPAYTTLFGDSAVTMQLTGAKGGVVGLWAPVAVGLILLGAFLVPVLLRWAVGSPRRTVPTWTCGFSVPEEEMRFRADSYYSPVKRFVKLITPHRRSEWLPARSERAHVALDLDIWLYKPVTRGVLGLFRWFSKSHVGIPQVYAAWIVIGFVGSLIFLLTH